MRVTVERRLILSTVSSLKGKNITAMSKFHRKPTVMGMEMLCTRYQQASPMGDHWYLLGIFMKPYNISRMKDYSNPTKHSFLTSDCTFSANILYEISPLSTINFLPVTVLTTILSDLILLFLTCRTAEIISLNVNE